jgi:hypothetical protein
MRLSPLAALRRDQEQLALSLIFDRLLPSQKSPIVILQLQVTVTILLVLESNGVTVPLRN